MLRISPPGFPKPIWRGWEGGAGTVAGAAVKERLAVAVTTIERSLGGCHKEKVTRDLTDCPGSNQHHYVRQQPHRCEVLPTTTRKRESKGNLTEILQYNIHFSHTKQNQTRLPASRSSSIGPEDRFSFFHPKVKVIIEKNRFFGI